MPDANASLIIILAGSLLTLGCLVGAFFALRKKRLIDDVPTSKTQGVFIGLVELKGTAESEEPLTSYLAGTRCVHYSWQVDEHWQRTVHETYTDSKGRTQTRTRIESGWKKVAGQTTSIPFYLQDDTGVIRIRPESADVHSIRVFDRTCSRNDPLYYEKGPTGSVPNSTHRRRFTETALPLHTKLYVMGQAHEREDIVAPEIVHDKKAPIFVISTKTEKQLRNRYTFRYWLWTVLAFIVALGGGAGWSMVTIDILVWQPLVIAGGGFFAAMLLGWTWSVYNSLINLHHMVRRSWSEIDIQLKRRHDLIPNLVKAVEGYRNYESEVQVLLADMRTQTDATPKGMEGPDIKGLVQELAAVVERYPDLKANKSFLKLQHSLTDTEQRIALARDYYNNIATFYNTRLEIIPDRFVAALARLRPETLLAAADFERPPVPVRLVD